MLRSFQEIEDMLRKSPSKKKIVVASAHDEHTLDAIMMAVERGMVEPVLVGNKVKILEILNGLNADISKMDIIDIPDPVEATKKAAELIRAGEVDCAMKGKIETGALMKVFVNKEEGIRKNDTMSLLAFMDSPYYHKVFAVTDVGLLTYPTLEQKKASIENAVSAFQALGVENPKVAVLAAVEKLNPKMKETIEADTLKQMNTNGEIKGCIIEGPISYDLTMDPDAAAIKGYESEVAGDADILVVPDIVSGNLLAKALTCTGGAATCGIILGAMVPLIITSRSAKVEDKYMAIVLSALAGKK